jgi:U1 small nuclear ribonucleoprotein
VKLVYDKFTEKPRGYGFVEFEHERDMKTAYKHADGRKIDGRRILVDVERGRTVKDWKPRKCGGGLGSSRKDRPKKTPAEKAEQRRYEAAQAARAARMAAAATSSVPPANSAVRARYEGKDDDRPSYRRDDDRGSRDDRRRDDRGGDNDRSRSSRGDDYGGSRGDYSGSRGGYDDYRGGGGGGGGGGGSRYDDYRR